MNFRITIQQIDDDGKEYKISSNWHDHMKQAYKEATQTLNTVNICFREEEI